jgi:hypothetical protein
VIGVRCALAALDVDEPRGVVAKLPTDDIDFSSTLFSQRSPLANGKQLGIGCFGEHRANVADPNVGIPAKVLHPATFGFAGPKLDQQCALDRSDTETTWPSDGQFCAPCAPPVVYYEKQALVLQRLLNFNAGYCLDLGLGFRPENE